MTKKKEPDQRVPQMREVFEEVLTTLHEAHDAPPEQDIDLDKALVDLEHGLEELTSKADALYKATGMTKEQVEDYAKNPSNFTPEEWKMLEEIRSEVGAMREEAEAALSSPVEEEKPKRRPAKKKKWLQG